jgi:hypothetical protein
VDGFGPNRLELIPDGFKKTVQNWLGTVLAKPSEIADGLAQTVHNPNQRRTILDGLKPSRKNRLDLFPDSFLQFLDGLKPSRIPKFFVVPFLPQFP